VTERGGGQLGFEFETPGGAGEPPATPAPPPAGAGPPPSEEQRRILAFDDDLVVTAGAGSGKTRTLVDLYVRILGEPGLLRGETEPIGPRRILCLTFTERAAREILARIRARLDDAEQRRELETAPVTTFHGWCARLLRDHPLEAGVDPRFRVMTEETAGGMLRRAAVDTLRRGLDTGDEAARRAVTLLGLGRAADVLVGLVRELRTAGWEIRRPIERFEAVLEEVEADLEKLAREVDAAMDELLEVARSESLTDLGEEHREAIGALYETWRVSRGYTDAMALSGRVRSAGRSWRFEASKALRNRVVERADAYAGAALESEHRHQLGAWPALTVSVRETYRAARFGRGALDYDDLLLRARDLLAGHDAIRETLRRRYRAILVDEHQDTDPVQDDILRLLVGEDAIAGEPDGRDPRWCVVGDGQQSIYGFRGATVAAFERLARAADERGAHRPLSRNFRSREALVRFHNAFFPRILPGGERTDEIAYASQRPHRPPDDEPAVELLDPGDEPGLAAEARDREARALAARLAAACSASDPDAVTVVDPESGEVRAARPGDVVVLLRRMTQVETYRRALEAVGLDSIVVGSGGFYERQEVYDVLNALEAAVLHDPVPLVGYLRSPMVGLPDDAVQELLRGWDRRTPLLAHVRDRASRTTLQPGETDAIDHGLEVLDELVARSADEPPGTVVARLVDRTGYAAVLEALPDRGQRRANLERLVAIADRAADEGTPLLAEWIALLKRRVEAPPRDRDAALPEGDRVRVMSIHQAKGLEFAVVALADLGGQPRGGIGAVAFDPDLGTVARWFPEPGAKGVATRSHARAAEAAKRRREAEEARLLYVAATRARDRLLLSAGTSSHRWFEAVRAFATTEPASDVLVARDQAAWVERFRAAFGPAPPLAGTGEPVAEPLAASPGEYGARELAAIVAGEPETASPVPAAREPALRALRRGQRGHAALERLPLDVPDGFDTAAWLRDRGLPAGEVRPLAAFVDGTLRPALVGARVVHRERPFRLALPGGAVVAGAIDVLWRAADGRWRVGDYKFAEPDPGAEGRHRIQLGIYALAVAAALGEKEIGGVVWYVDGPGGDELAWSCDDLAALEARLDRATRFEEAS